MDLTRPAPPCPECGGARFWYGSVEFWVGGTSHGANDQLNAAVCGNCGYSSLYLQNMPGISSGLGDGLCPAHRRSRGCARLADGVRPDGPLGGPGVPPGRPQAAQVRKHLIIADNEQGRATGWLPGELSERGRAESGPDAAVPGWADEFGWKANAALPPLKLTTFTLANIRLDRSFPPHECIFAKRCRLPLIWLVCGFMLNSVSRGAGTQHLPTARRRPDDLSSWHSQSRQPQDSRA